MSAPRTSLLITDAFLYLDRGLEIANGWIFIENGRVVSHGPMTTTPPQAETRLCANGRIVTPGLVNAHHHMYQNLTRSYAPVVNGTFSSG